ncbi:DUF7948 domain-containing protein [Chryseobacterium sp. T1]
MKKLYLLFLLNLFLTAFSQTQKNNYFFYENKGQIIDQKSRPNTDVKYLFISNGLNVQIKKTGFSYDVHEVDKTILKTKKEISKKNESYHPKKRQQEKFEYRSRYHRVDIDLVNASKNVEIIAEGQSVDYENYYNLQYKPEGVEKVHRYQRIVYKNIYDHVDLVFFKPEDSTKTVEYNFLVHPGGKISDIKMKFNGAKTKLKNGKLSMALRFGEMQENIPNSWIEHQYSKQNIVVNFKDLGNQTFGFDSSINTSDKTIVIDPVPTRIWGSYFGGNREDEGYVKTDNNDDVYVFGTTLSDINIATSGSYQPTWNSSGFADAFLSKITKDGSQKLWGTYYGLKFYDSFLQITFDDKNNVYATGEISIPSVTNPNNPYSASEDISLVKFSTTGTMIFNKTFGGNRTDLPWDVAYLNGKVYVIGETLSRTNLATPGTYQPTNIGNYKKSFIGKFDAANGNTDWVTFFGGPSGATTLKQIFNTGSNYIEIMGATTANDTPLLNPINISNNGLNVNGLHIIFDESGSLKYSTLIGDDKSSNYYDYINYARRIGNHIYFIGKAENALGKKNGLLYKIDTSINSIISRKEFYLYDDFHYIPYIDDKGGIFVSGSTINYGPWVNMVATPDAFLTMPPISTYINVFVIKYDLDLNKIWGTFYFGNQLNEVIKDNSDHIYFYGIEHGNSSNISTPGVFQENRLNTSSNIYIAKFKDCTSSASISSNSPICIGSDIELKASGGTSYAWTGPNGFTSTLQNPIINNANTIQSGTYSCAITGTGGCDSTYTVNVFVGDIEKPVPDLPSLPKITANCKTIISTKPTATDKCKGLVIGITSDPLSYSIPGTYNITWTYDDGAGNIATQTQEVEITDQPKPVANSTQNFCAITQPKISDIQVSGVGLQWYNSTGNNLL